MAKQTAKPKPGPPKNSERSKGYALSGWLRDELKKILAALTIAIIAAAGFWLSPLKEIVIQKLYPESAEIVLIADRKEIRKGQTVKIDVRVAQKSYFPVSPGNLEISIADNKLLAVPGHGLIVPSKEISGVALITSEKPMLLAPADDAGGDARIEARLLTRYNTYKSNVLSIRILSDASSDLPFLEHGGSSAINLSGEWRIEISAMIGKMKIKQSANADIQGSFEVATNEGTKTGSIQGYKDGTTFRAFFDASPNPKERWRVEGNFAINDVDKKFIEIKGCVYSIVKDNEIVAETFVSDSNKCPPKRNYVGWRGVSTYQFYAVAQLLL